MWEVSTHRVRAYLKQRKHREHAQAAKDKAKEKFSLCRVEGQIILLPRKFQLGAKPQVFPVTIFLNDLRQEGMYVSTDYPLEIGGKIGITFDSPRRFYALGTVVASYLCNRELHMFHQHSLDYRVGIKFEIRNSAEERSIAAFHELLRRYLRSPRSLESYL